MRQSPWQVTQRLPALSGAQGGKELYGRSSNPATRASEPADAIVLETLVMGKMLRGVHSKAPVDDDTTGPAGLEKDHALRRKELNTFRKTPSHLLLSSVRDRELGHGAPSHRAARIAQHEHQPIRPTGS